MKNMNESEINENENIRDYNHLSIIPDGAVSTAKIGSFDINEYFTINPDAIKYFDSVDEFYKTHLLINTIKDFPLIATLLKKYLSKKYNRPSYFLTLKPNQKSEK